MSADFNQPSSASAVEQSAAQWQSRRDRGLSATEQDAYLQWLREDSRHGAAISRLEKVWGVLDQLAEWRPAHSPLPNPDLLAPKRHGKFYWLSTAIFAAAAAIAVLLVVDPMHLRSPHRRAIIHPGPERMALEDGSVIELNAGAKVEVHYTPEFRNVTLVQGEAHFTVAKNRDRPFVVSANKVAVRAVGTAFSVSLDQNAVGVLVTEGVVRVVEETAMGVTSSTDPAMFEWGAAKLTAGQRTTVDLASAATLPLVVQELTPSQIERSLAWQGMRLEFVEMPLGDVVQEFNRYNRQKLVVADRATAKILIGGSFRADNVESFVRLIQATSNISVHTEGDEIMLEFER
jgi:transmembrane sensor